MNLIREGYARIVQAQSVEQRWWRNVTAFPTEDDIVAAVSEGILIPVVDKIWYKVSERCVPMPRALRPPAHRLLERLSLEWARELLRIAPVTHDVFLLVTSLTRPVKYQKELIARDFPAVPNSTHTRGLAFDISYGWLLNNSEPGFEALCAVVEQLKKGRLANVIDEPSQQIFHLAPSPKFAKQIQY